MAIKEIRLSVWLEEHAEEEAMITFRDLVAPETPPYLEDGTEVVDMTAEAEPSEEINRAFGGRTNVPASNVVRAIRRDIGTIRLRPSYLRQKLHRVLHLGGVQIRQIP